MKTRIRICFWRTLNPSYGLNQNHSNELFGASDMYFLIGAARAKKEEVNSEDEVGTAAVHPA
jgi:hypothetical protein